MSFPIYSPQSLTPQPNTRGGELVFYDGYIIPCTITVEEVSYDSQFWFMSQYAIEISFTCPQNSQTLNYLRSKISNLAKSYKEDIYYQYCSGDDRMFFKGFFIKSLSLNMNGDIDVEGCCDYYYGEITEQERVRRLRKKKLKRILNGK